MSVHHSCPKKYEPTPDYAQPSLLPENMNRHRITPPVSPGSRISGRRLDPFTWSGCPRNLLEHPPLGDGARRICRQADAHGLGPAGPSGPGENIASGRSRGVRHQLADRPERFAEIAIELLVDHIRPVVERLDLGVDRSRFNCPDGGVAGFGNQRKASVPAWASKATPNAGPSLEFRVCTSPP